MINNNELPPDAQEMLGNNYPEKKLREEMSALYFSNLDEIEKSWAKAREKGFVDSSANDHLHQLCQEGQSLLAKIVNLEINAKVKSSSDFIDWENSTEQKRK